MIRRSGHEPDPCTPRARKRVTHDSLRDRLADPGQNPPAVRSDNSRIRGGAWAEQRRGRCPGADPAAVMTTGARRGLASGTTGSDASRVEAAPLAVAWRVRTRCRAQGRQRRQGAEGCWKLQIDRLFCKPICKPDPARQYETGETEPTERNGICLVRRDHHVRERLLETPETHVVWLITQRSRVQIPPPLPSLQVKGLFRSRRRPLLTLVLTAGAQLEHRYVVLRGDEGRTARGMPTVATHVADLLHFTCDRHPRPRSP
jgi:hypothetical protein